MKLDVANNNQLCGSSLGPTESSGQARSSHTARLSPVRSHRTSYPLDYP